MVRRLGWVGFVATFSGACQGHMAAPNATKSVAVPVVAPKPSPAEVSSAMLNSAALSPPAETIPAIIAPCPSDMVAVQHGSFHFCIDSFEASVVEVRPDGTEEPYPHNVPVDGKLVRAISQRGVFPQGYISQVQAKEACEGSQKRLCRYDEWKLACTSGSTRKYPYGNSRASGTCHDHGTSPVISVFGAQATFGLLAATHAKPLLLLPGDPGAPKHASIKVTKKSTHASKKKGASRTKTPTSVSRPPTVNLAVWTKLNDPRLGQVEGAVARAGDHEGCETEDGAFDMVGNLHEWVDTDASQVIVAGKPGAAIHGVFAGGYFLDTQKNGDGCEYATRAHAREYHDYSTGFRCCSEILSSSATHD